ncbi:MAG TPA: peroxiredoxin [Mycobacteriales bacterium]|jgi:peroxiredoxin|nr:peroxiredoxin [Mycobacteriales bacterium]
MTERDRRRAAVGVADRLPDVQVMMMTPQGPVAVSTADVLGSGTVVLFGVPGAFTPVCSDHHLPGFVLRAGDLRAKGVQTIACLSVNDAFVMSAWGRAEGADGAVLMIADPDAAFTRAMGLAMDASDVGLGTRSQRYAAVLHDGVITSLAVETHFVDHAVSTADAVLSEL